jgi:hypothetical protein
MRDRQEIVPQDPDGERQEKRRVGQDQRLVAVQPAQAAQQQVEGRDHGDLREDGDHEQHHQEGELAAHRKPAQRIPGEGAQHEHQHGRHDRHDQ